MSWFDDDERADALAIVVLGVACILMQATIVGAADATILFDFSSVITARRRDAIRARSPSISVVSSSSKAVATTGGCAVVLLAESLLWRDALIAYSSRYLSLMRMEDRSGGWRLRLDLLSRLNCAALLVCFLGALLGVDTFDCRCMVISLSVGILVMIDLHGRAGEWEEISESMLWSSDRRGPETKCDRPIPVVFLLLVMSTLVLGIATYPG